MLSRALDLFMACITKSDREAIFDFESHLGHNSSQSSVQEVNGPGGRKYEHRETGTSIR